ncbi:MAG TPA: SDR family oxidoreductase [Blastocatellia bacterium]|jgi:3-oxoacyl-[acyl-carrier protein] reductase
MAHPLADKVAIITGASSGIGRAAAFSLAKHGVKLALFARTESALAEVAERSKRHGAPDTGKFVCDVRSEKSVGQAMAATLKQFERIDILINSAGLSLNGDVDGYSLSDWQTVLETNLTGTFLTCRAVLPAMKKQGGGQIINISSGAGRDGIKSMSAYCASKFGVIGFTESLGHEVRDQNIRVSVLLPGSVATNFSRIARRKERTGEHSSVGATAAVDIGYSMTPEEVATVIVSMLEQPPQAWMSEVVLRPLNLELRRTRTKA